MLFNVSHAVLFWFESSCETERLASMLLPGLLRRGTCKFHATLPGFVCASRRLWAQGAGHFLHPDRFISRPFVCLFYSTVDPHTETWNKHIRSIKIIPWRRCTKAIYKSFKGPLNLKTPSEWHGADAYGLHVIIMGMHYKNKATDECVKSKINPIFITLTTVSYTSSNDMHLDS